MEPLTINEASRSEPCTLNPAPKTTLHLKPPYTLNPEAYTLHPTPYTLNPEPYTQNPEPYTLNPTPYTLNPNSQT